MAITYTKLKNGDWGLRADRALTPGTTATVKKASGETKAETVGKLVWSGNGVHLYTTQRSAVAATKSGSSRGQRTGCSCGSRTDEHGQLINRETACWTCRHDDE